MDILKMKMVHTLGMNTRKKGLGIRSPEEACKGEEVPPHPMKRLRIKSLGGIPHEVILFIIA